MRKTLITIVTGLLIASPLAIATAPTAAACDVESGEICDKTETGGVKPPPVWEDPCADGGCPEGGGGEGPPSGVWWTTQTTGGAKYFWESGTVFLGVPFAPQDYSGLYGMAQCGPQKGYADAAPGTTYNIRAGYYTVDTTRHWWSFYSGGVPYEIVDPPVRSYRSLCETYTVPALVNTPLTVMGEWVENGPFNYDGKSMLTVADGGTLTRKNKAGVITTQGDVGVGISPLGNKILNRLGEFDPAVLKTSRGLATPAEARWGIEQGVLGYSQKNDIVMDDYGRYYIAATRTRDAAFVQSFTGRYAGFLDKMFPAKMTETDVRFFPAANGYPAQWIERVGGPTAEHDLYGYSVHCEEDGTPGGRSTRDRVGEYHPARISDITVLDASGVMPSAVAGAFTWGDDALTYTNRCAQGKVTTEEVRTRDLFQCDRYDSTFTFDRNVRPVTYTTQTGTRWAQTGWNWYWGCSCGGTCGNWSNGDPYCRTAQWGWETYTYTTEDPTPADYTKSGSNWVQNCPTGYTAISGTQCQLVKYSDIIVDDLNATPIDDYSPDNLVELTGSDRERLNVKTGAWGEWLNFVWRKPSVSVNTGSDKGKNVNALPASADVRWSRMWSLNPTSTPILRDDEVDRENPTPAKVSEINNPDGPTHIWTDPDATSNAGDPAASDDWQPATDDGSGDAVYNKWVGLEPKGWEVSQRSLWTRFFMSGTAGADLGWELTPWWKVTATVPVETTTVDKVTFDGNGGISFDSSTSTEMRRESYVCPGQRLEVDVNRIVS